LPHCLRVSILTRAFARVQPAVTAWLAILGVVFQSSLELSPECNGLNLKSVRRLP